MKDHTMLDPPTAVRSATRQNLQTQQKPSEIAIWPGILILTALGLLLTFLLPVWLVTFLLTGTALLATVTICARAVFSTPGQTLSVQVKSRLLILLMLALLLFFTGGSLWSTVASAVLLCLSADRLLTN